VAIKISNLKSISDDYASRQYFYNDLHLDFTFQQNYSPALGTRPTMNDIKMSYDESAIRNSLQNLFNTRPGQRFLFPNYGLDLNEFVFESATEDNARLIGEKIANAIYNYEPRVTLKRCIVIPDPDNNVFDVTVIVEIPLFSTELTINTNLDNRTKSFVFIGTSRNR
jgi:phage baseplate assembly protein W